MAKWVNDAVMDLALAGIATGNKLFLCSAQPATYAEAGTTYVLADHDLTVGHGNGDYTIANGASSGRKITVTAQTGIDVDGNGTVTYVAIGRSSDSTLLLVSSLTTPKAVVSTDTVDLAAFTYTLPDPS